MIYLFILGLIILFIKLYRSIDNGSKIAYLIYRYSGLVTMVFFSIFLFQVHLAFESGAKRIPLYSIFIAVFTYMIWYTKVCMLIIKSERKGFFWGILKLLAYITSMMFPFNLLANKMYRRYEVEHRQ